MGNNKLINLQQTYDAIAAEFDITRYKPWPQTVEFIESLPDGCSILDLGCGNGRNIKYLLDVNRGFKILGLDFSKRLLRLAQDKLRRDYTRTSTTFKLLLGDISCLPLKNNSMDAALSVATLHHLPSAELRLHSLQELVRVLKPGGRAFISVWDFEQERFTNELNRQLEQRPSDGEFGDVLVDWKGKRGDRYQRFYHLFYKDEFEKLLLNAKFKIDKLFRAADNFHAIVSKN